MKQLIHNLKLRLLGWLLDLVNREIKHWNYDWGFHHYTANRDALYNIKNDLLFKYGVNVGTDLQHIKKNCHSCNGTGIFRCHWKEKETCWACGGSGVYEEFYTILYRYKLGSYQFHWPYKRINRNETGFGMLNEKAFDSVIEGYVQSVRPKYKSGVEASFWLLLIYNRPLFDKLKSGFPFWIHGKTFPFIFPLITFFRCRYLWKNRKLIPGWIWDKTVGLWYDFKNFLLDLRDKYNYKKISIEFEDDLPF